MRFAAAATVARLRRRAQGQFLNFHDPIQPNSTLQTYPLPPTIGLPTEYLLPLAVFFFFFFPLFTREVDLTFHRRLVSFQ